MSDNQQSNKPTAKDKWLAGGAIATIMAVFAAVAVVDKMDPLASDEQKFVRAAENGNIDKINHLVENGVDLEDWAGFSALSAASQNSEVEAVQRLLTLHSYSNNEIYRAAAESAREGHNDVLEFFISEGLDVNSDFRYGLSILEGAVWNNHHHTLDLLLQEGIDVTNPNTRADGAMSFAIQEGYTEMVTKLLDAGMNVNTRTYGRDVLSNAALWGHMDIAQLALERGADVSANNHDATRRAAQYGHNDILDLLIERGGSVKAANEGFAIRSAKRGDIGEFREILQEQPEVLQTVGGRLMASAAYNNNINFVEMLIEEGLTSADELGSALIFAASRNHKDILELLLNQNANFNEAEYDYLNSALFFATQDNHKDCVELLLAHGADPRVNAGHYIAPIDMTNRNRAITRMFKEYLEQQQEAPSLSMP